MCVCFVCGLNCSTINQSIFYSQYPTQDMLVAAPAEPEESQYRLLDALWRAAQQVKGKAKGLPEVDPLPLWPDGPKGKGMGSKGHEAGEALTPGPVGDRDGRRGDGKGEGKDDGKAEGKDGGKRRR